MVPFLTLAGCTPHGDDVVVSPPPGNTPAVLPAVTAPLASESPPLGRLPAGVRPSHYKLTLEVVPERERFIGAVEIQIENDRARDVVWIHGRGLVSQSATIRPEGMAPIAAKWEQVDPSGVVALRLARPLPPGKALIRVEYDAPFGQRLDAMYRVEQGGKAYAFTQFESIYARQTFPSFDEPAFKTPFDITLVVSKDAEAVANTREIERVAMPDGMKRITFTTTEPLPTYLLAFAVGPLDIVTAPDIAPNAVRKRGLPLRGVAAKGRGKELAYALANTPAIVAALENYTGIEYPYDKLDILAVPDRGGAMENAGAITFNEWLLLFDEKSAPAGQKRAFASVMAHELAHMWFGDLVTMPWWDDIWLNEAFATWMASRIAGEVFPKEDFETANLERVHGIMTTDGLLNARQIRQEIRTQHDIFNAFDGITYQKGRGVLLMFERWIGKDAFRRGVQNYLKEHRFGNATAKDFLAAISKASGKDIAAAFSTFLDQPGLPLVEAKLTCDKKPALALEQSRDLPVGSPGDRNRSWQVPVCARYSSKGAIREACTLLTERKGSLPLEGDACPEWVMPNADGAGYYRWSLPAADMARLSSTAYPKLGVRERMSLGESIRGAFDRGAIAGKDAFATLAPLAKDSERTVATAPMGMLRTARRWFEGDPAKSAVEAFGRTLYAPLYRELGWEAKKAQNAPPEDSDRQLLRQDVIGFLALSAMDPAVRKEAAARGRAYVGFGADGAIHRDAVDPNLAGIALAVAAQEGDAKLFDALLKLLDKSDNEDIRGHILRALGSVRAPDLSRRAMELSLGTAVRLKVREQMDTIGMQLHQQETQQAGWQWVKEHLDPLIARISPSRAGGLPFLATGFCDAAHAAELKQLFAARIDKLDGGPRNLASAVEKIELCAAHRKAQEESVRAFFAKGKGSATGALLNQRQ
jgi:alanyl aminopeptidase